MNDNNRYAELRRLSVDESILPGMLLMTMWPHGKNERFMYLILSSPFFNPNDGIAQVHVLAYGQGGENAGRPVIKRISVFHLRHIAKVLM